METLPLLNKRYQLLKPIGHGGMAHIYSAQDQILGRLVAIKILKQTLSSDTTFRERFQREAQAAANLTHPNIVTIHDFGIDRDRLFIVMEYVAGTDLKTYIQQHGSLPVDQAVDLMVQATAGIGYAHRAGLIHCDIKPQNLLITPDHRLKVTDFGIARALASISPDERNQEIWGTPQYFSPEQAAGIAPLPASDVYSLGVVFFELLTGQLPFDAMTASELRRLHLNTPPPDPLKLNPRIPPELGGILLKILSKQPTQRYRSAEQLNHILKVYTQAGPRQSFEPVVNSNTDTLVVPKETIEQISLKDQMDQLDWVTIGLSLITLAAVGGLIPLWLAILFQII